MDNLFTRQIIGISHLALPSFAASQSPTFLQQSRSGSMMDSSIHATTSQQRLVCRIHDGIHFQCRDVTNYNLDILHHENLYYKSLFDRSEKTKEKENGSIRRRNAFRIADDVIVTIPNCAIGVNLPKR